MRTVPKRNHWIRTNVVGRESVMQVKSFSVAGFLTVPILTPVWWHGLLTTRAGTYHGLPLRKTPPEGSSVILLVMKEY